MGRVRDVNEDSLLALPDEGVWLVADGMGGHEAGDFASQAIVDSVATMPHGLEASGRMHWLRHAINRAHDRIRDAADQRGGSTIGATVVALLLTDRNFVAFWAGDSRLYLMRDGELRQLTVDHTLVAPLVESGKLTWDEAERLPEANVITRAVGVGNEVELAKVRGTAAPGDRFLICSDGLSRYFGVGLLAETLSAEPLETVADTLVEGALELGGADNISVIVIDVT